MLELAKILAGIIGGGLAGAFITEWFRRRRGKVQSVQLIERVFNLKQCSDCVVLLGGKY
jgi:hypothetical protein